MSPPIADKIRPARRHHALTVEVRTGIVGQWPLCPLLGASACQGCAGVVLGLCWGDLVIGARGKRHSYCSITLYKGRHPAPRSAGGTRVLYSEGLAQIRFVSRSRSHG